MMRHLGSDRLRLWSPLIAIQPEPSRPPCSSMPASRRKHSPIALEKDEINPRQIQGKMVVTAGNSFEVAPSVFQRSDNFFDILSRALRDFNFRDADALYPICIYL